MKEDTSSPTVMQESLMATCIIKSMERRNVDIAIMPGTFLQTYMVHGDRTVCVSICSVLADIFFSIYPENFVYKVVLEGGHKVFYTSLKNYLYSSLIASLLLWRDMSVALGSWSFKPNPYGICVVNKKVNRKQCKIY